MPSFSPAVLFRKSNSIYLSTMESWWGVRSLKLNLFCHFIKFGGKITFAILDPILESMKKC